MRHGVDRILIPLIVAGWCALVTSFSPASAAQKVVKSPEVIHTGKAPTGYAVTFRHVNPAAQKVQIKGEWYSARPSELSQLAGTPDRPVIEGQGLLPRDWQPGDFPLQHPNATGPNFPIADMTKGRDGVWTYTTPLPSGTFTCAFMVDCNNPNPSQCPRIADPNNRPWNETNGVARGNAAPNSQVFVPSDPGFNTTDYAWQGPAKIKGKLAHETCASPGHVTPEDENYLVIYTPPNYDPKRARPYPTLYLSHGGGENEMGWSTQGMINTGEMQPIVVVMPNGMGYAQSTFNEAYEQDLINNMIPFIEQRYHVSKSSMDRAFSGLSMGGMLTTPSSSNTPKCSSASA